MWNNPLFHTLNELRILNMSVLLSWNLNLRKRPENYLVLPPHTVSQPALQWVSEGCLPLLSPPLHLWSGGIGFSLVLWAFPNTSRISGAWRVYLEWRASKSIGCHCSRARHKQKRPPKATVLMGTDDTASSEMCSYLSLSSIYRSSTLITQFKFSWEKAVFRMSFTISPKYKFCSGRFMHDVLLHDSVQCTIFLHILSWLKKSLGICDSNGNLSLLEGKIYFKFTHTHSAPPSVFVIHSLFMPASISICHSVFFLSILQVSNYSHLFVSFRHHNFSAWWTILLVFHLFPPLTAALSPAFFFPNKGRLLVLNQTFMNYERPLSSSKTESFHCQPGYLLLLRKDRWCSKEHLKFYYVILSFLAAWQSSWWPLVHVRVQTIPCSTGWNMDSSTNSIFHRNKNQLKISPMNPWLS